MFVLSCCTRPQKGPSPFDQLAETQVATSPEPGSLVEGPDFLIIPDLSLVYSAGSADFSIERYISKDSGLSGYQELVDEKVLSGAEIVAKLSREYSVNPRLLLALLDFQSGWVSNGQLPAAAQYPIFPEDESQQRLYRQLSWAANELNRGFYLRRVGALDEILLADGTRVQVSPQINDASAALQYVLGKLAGYSEWQSAVGPLGIHITLLSLFGEAGALTQASTLIPELIQPELYLPFEAGQTWFYTSGPHSAWGDGAAWAALDFAPDEDEFGCYRASAWVTAAADGLIIRSGDGQVVQDLDGDEDEGTGWTLLYMHISDEDRVPAGAYLKAGDKIGHPSCTGGPASGTHLHIARRFNGEWIPADQDCPFILSGWTSKGEGVEYDGSLVRDGLEIFASAFPTDENKITP